MPTSWCSPKASTDCSAAARASRPPPKPETVALAVKEMHFLPQETIEQRFNVKGDEGVVIEAVGADLARA